MASKQLLPWFVNPLINSHWIHHDSSRVADAIAKSGGGPHFHMAHIRPDVLTGDLLKGDLGETFASTSSLSFAHGTHGQVAIKVIYPRSNKRTTVPRI